MSAQAQGKELIADRHRSPDFTEMAALPSAERALHQASREITGSSTTGLPCPKCCGPGSGRPG